MINIKNKVKNIFYLGISIGLIVSSLLIIIFDNKDKTISKYVIEKEAKKLGMHYEDECKSILNK